MERERKKESKKSASFKVAHVVNIKLAFTDRFF